MPASVRAALRRAGWPEAAWRWEQAMAHGLSALTEGDPLQAQGCFVRAQAIADAGLPADDLRRISAPANLAALAGDTAKLRALRAIWQTGGPWVATLRPDARARSSLFHMRLQAKHRAGYDHLSKRRNARLFADAAARLDLLLDPDQSRVAGAASALSRWRQASISLGFVDQRKLHAAAALLIGL